MNTQIIWMIFIKILKNTMQIKNDKVFFFFFYILLQIWIKIKKNKIVTELFIRGRNLNISLVFITQSYFEVPKDVRLNTTLFLL